MTDTETILSVEKINAGYGRIRVLHDLSFQVERGQIFGVIGPNGSGKTTMLNAVSGLIRNTAGKILLNGKDISRLSADVRCRMGIGRTYQIPRPFSRMSVFENVLVAAVCGGGLAESTAREPASDVLRATGLYEMRNLLSGSLTLLDRKRLEIARAIAARPKLLLLDEVAAGLTAEETREVMQMVKKLKNSGFTILWIEHDIAAMLQATDILMCMSEGRSVMIGPPAEVLASREVEAIYLGNGLEGRLHAED